MQKPDANAQFCAGCGHQFGEAQAQPQAAPPVAAPAPPAPGAVPPPGYAPQPTYAPQPQMQWPYQPPTDMGALLASGNGLKSNATLMLALCFGGLVASSIVLAFVMGVSIIRIPGFGRIPDTRTVITNGWLVFWIFVAMVEIALGVLAILSVRKTRVEVYEKGIAGIGASKIFFLGDIRMRNFAYKHGEVHVAGTNQQVTVNLPGVQYVAFAQNANEIRQISFQQKQQQQ